ncbi:sprouty-related, EVH1 domain-containing protein 1-like isoform X1 [Amphibalanus amphitrite]|uniref:sprouty-related, EVH1 domain-containing protein 1-like isoform X1 n=1 Tax=Amphibalanus amphitrite TaxID=1232801 RepID=UPI001C9102D7|nr:sprouty-related, EVH1 domain-containing protein 1-like isoform X1 [Amphibalanus amphitrite]XP_043235540.1 sprouty-related, EVH1 domain-containing protein 1-like isoform X1 [Amphibalanus amphitrite]
MTEGYEDGGSLVLVQAQVMMRDDSMGGWLPMGGWGLSKVSVRKRHPRYEHVNADHPKTEYIIFGKRINDGVSVLNCTIKKDFVYHKVMPTFHHWKTGEKKFGLTFQTAADARAFDRGVRQAVQDLLDGLSDSDSSPLYVTPPPPHDRPPPPPPPLHGRPPPPPPPSVTRPDLGDNDVFMTLELPVDRYDSRSSSDSSVSRQTAASPQSALLHRMAFGPTAAAAVPAAGGGGGSAPPTGPLSDESAASEYPYVQFARDRPSKHEYSYPAMEDLVKQKELLKRNAETMHLTQPPLPKSGKRRVETRRPLPRRCRHCQEPYDEESNGRGQCEYAPDPVRSCLEAVTCLPAAQCMLYHCCADSEGDFGSGPCACAPREERCARRWLGLTLLSALLPCLCCYPLVAGCYRLCRRCHACGGSTGPLRTRSEYTHTH